MSRPSDIIVVGAGIIGCAVAYELARRGASVEVVDERTVGMGATQASAGILAPYIEASQGNALFDLTVQSLLMYDEFIERVSADSGLPISYRRTGTLAVATDETSLHALQATAAVLAQQGVAAELIDKQSARLEEPHLADDVLGALLISTHGYVSADDLTRALVAAARRHGAQLVEQSRVKRISRAGADVIVETDRGSLGGNAVVLAAGTWSGGIEIDGVAPRVPVKPVRGQLLYLSWSGSRLRRVVWSPRCYLVPRDEGTVLVGATTEQAGFDERTTVAGVRDLLDAACGIVPQAWKAGFVGARVGLRPGTSDDLPIIGPSRIVPGLMYATGHYRNGVLLAPLTAQLVAEAMLDGRVDPALDALSPSRFGGNCKESPVVSGFRLRKYFGGPAALAEPGQPDRRQTMKLRTVATERAGRWIARAEDEETGRPFGIECAGATADDATERLTRWLEWQREHAAALDVLQTAERAYHRTIAGSAFASPTEGPSPLELQKESLEAVEAARIRLDEIRERKPD